MKSFVTSHSNEMALIGESKFVTGESEITKNLIINILFNV